MTDANGNEITDPNHLGRVNPIRYRGYYYDEETGLYYLQSRYYDPIIGRFINADGIIGPNNMVEDTNYNLFAYCMNNPIIFGDANGYNVYFVSLNISASAILGVSASLTLAWDDYGTIKSFWSFNTMVGLTAGLGPSVTGGFIWDMDTVDEFTQDVLSLGGGAVGVRIAALCLNDEIIGVSVELGDSIVDLSASFGYTGELYTFVDNHPPVSTPSSNSPSVPKPAPQKSNLEIAAEIMGGKGHYINLHGSGKIWVYD